MSASIGAATDTPDAVMAEMVDRWRRMSPFEKLEQVAQLNQACEQLSEAGVRSRYPDADDDEVRLRVFALRLGRELEQWVRRHVSSDTGARCRYRRQLTRWAWGKRDQL